MLRRQRQYQHLQKLATECKVFDIGNLFDQQVPSSKSIINEKIFIKSGRGRTRMTLSSNELSTVLTNIWVDSLHVA